MKRWTERVLLGLVIAAAITYAADWIVWRVKAAHGAGFGTVEVDYSLGTPLKGNKEEYDYLGSEPQACSLSLFPHGGAQACWWLKRHSSVWE